MAETINMRISVLIFCFSIHFHIAFADQLTQLSDSAEISLLTFSPGPLLYQTFGHSAIRVFDPKKGLDQIYNYGTFDFNAPNFYWKFVKGNLKYWLSISKNRQFIQEYILNDQSVYEHVFNFTEIEKQKVYEFLQVNYLPENRFYVYDFFYDNCATRIRDVIYHHAKIDIVLTDSSWYQKQSFRAAINPYLEKFPLAHLGIDLGLGLSTDQEMSVSESMFLPDYLMYGFENAKIIRDNQYYPLIKQKIVLHQSSIQSVERNDSFQINIILWALAVLIAVFTYIEIRKGGFYKWIDLLILLSLGLVGVVLTFFWSGTFHRATALNPDLLWACPLHLVMMVSAFLKIKYRWILHYYLWISMFMLMAFIALWGFLQYDFNQLIIPILFTYSLRVFRWYFLKPDNRN